MHIQSIDDEILNQIKLKYKDQDLVITHTLAKKEKGCTDNGQLVTWEHQIYVPKDLILREKIIRLHHASIITGHPNWFKTQELVTWNYW